MIDKAIKGLGKDQQLILNAGNNINQHLPFIDIRAKYIMKIMSLSGVEVMGIGPGELSLEGDQLKGLIELSPIHFVSANLSRFLPYVRLRKNGGNLKVLVTSVIDPEVLKLYKIGAGVEVADPVTALKRLQREIEHDLFIVIVHALGERISAIINGCPGIDLAIDGLTVSVSDNLGRGNVVPLVSNNYRGQYINYLEYRQGRKPRFSSPVVMRASVGQVAEDPGIKIQTQAYGEEKRLFTKRSQEPARRQRMEKNPSNSYLGSRACRHCHAVSVEKWARSRHSHAFASLVKKGRGEDIECLKCHVTGMGEKSATGGFMSFKSTPGMVDVQCEVCHGAGANHAQGPLQHKMKIMVEKGCRSCHTADSDPDFDFKSELLLIEHSEKGGRLED